MQSVQANSVHTSILPNSEAVALYSVDGPRSVSHEAIHSETCPISESSRSIPGQLADKHLLIISYSPMLVTKTDILHLLSLGSP
jgi:hypothetical protein